MKKLISILLAVMLVVSGLSLSSLAATEAYRYDFDAGLLAGNGGASSGTEHSITTGLEGLEVFTDAADIYIKGWCYTVSGVNQLLYKVGTADWAQIPEKGFADRSDVYEAITQEMTSLGIPAATNTTKSGFEYRIPLAGIALEKGMQVFQVKVVTNDGVEILLADVEFNYCDPYISSTPKKASARGNNSVVVDWNATFRDGSMTADTASSALQYSIGGADAIGSRGWISIDKEIDAFGYSYNDDANIIYDAAFSVETEQGVVDAGAYEFDQRYEIMVPTADLAIGTHKIKLYCKLVNTEQIIINELTVVVTERGEIIPNVQSSVADFMAQSAWTLDESVAFVEGADLTLGSGNYPGSTFRSVWAPRAVTGDSFIKVKVDATTSNKFVVFNGFTSYFSDNRWNGGYTFYADLAINEANSNRHGRGMFLNFSNENAGDAGKLFEQWYVTEDDFVVTGDTGILVCPFDPTTLKIAVLTYDLATDTRGAAVASIDLAASGVDFTKLTKFTAVDNGEGAIFVLVADAVVAKITYSNDGLYEEGTYAERYYKTAQIIGADGTVLAETDKAIISYYKTAGIGTRANTLYVDNVSLAEAIEVADPTAAPTEVTFTSGSNYYIYRNTNVIVAISTNPTGGIKSPEFFGNIFKSEYYQIKDNTGAVVTSTTKRISTGFTLELLDASGSLVKTYDIAILGDVTNDGRVNNVDINAITSSIKSYTTSTDFATDLLMAAANISNYTRGGTDTKINNIDANAAKAFFKSYGVWPVV